jgi:A/G-specific adenine glycosylase
MQLSDQQVQEFQETIWDYYQRAARSMPWRDQPTPYFVLVSELMLQQTQVSRVLPKFQAFIKAFPNITSLSGANQAEVLAAWSGLGYNRRAKFLHQAAQKVCQDFGGILPDSLEALITLPGIGKNTAGAILTYAYNQPVLFIETNIRTVYFYHFFKDQESVSDSLVLHLLRQTMDAGHPREWYWALMDYGAYLKQTVGNNVQLSKHYVKQSKFSGSKRQIRGQVLKLLIAKPLRLDQLARHISDARLATVLKDLQREGLLYQQDQQYTVVNPDS